MRKAKDASEGTAVKMRCGPGFQLFFPGPDDRTRSSLDRPLNKLPYVLLPRLMQLPDTALHCTTQCPFSSQRGDDQMHAVA